MADISLVLSTIFLGLLGVLLFYLLLRRMTAPKGPPAPPPKPQAGKKEEKKAQVTIVDPLLPLPHVSTYRPQPGHRAKFSSGRRPGRQSPSPRSSQRCLVRFARDTTAIADSTALPETQVGWHGANLRRHGGLPR